MPLPTYEDLPTRRPLLVARSHRLPEAGAERIRLVTTQTADAYRILQTTSTLTGSWARAEPDFTDAYHWLHNEMRHRLPTDADGMLWAWARIRRRDLHSELRMRSGEVHLTLDVPRERVLLHSFGDWHIVLNKGLHYPPMEGESDEA